MGCSAILIVLLLKSPNAIISRPRPNEPSTIQQQQEQQKPLQEEPQQQQKPQQEPQTQQQSFPTISIDPAQAKLIPGPNPVPEDWGPYAEQLTCLTDPNVVVGDEEEEEEEDDDYYDDDDEEEDDNTSASSSALDAMSIPSTAAPYGILLGVMKGGTRALMTLLDQHPEIVASKTNNGTGLLEVHYFNKRLVQTRQGIPQAYNRNRYQQFFVRQFQMKRQQEEEDDDDDDEEEDDDDDEESGNEDDYDEEDDDDYESDDEEEEDDDNTRGRRLLGNPHSSWVTTTIPSSHTPGRRRRSLTRTTSTTTTNTTMNPINRAMGSNQPWSTTTSTTTNTPFPSLTTQRRRRRNNQYQQRTLLSTTTHPTQIAVDDTPYLLAGGQRMVQAILCVAPWTKWMALLRNPIDRIDSQYRYKNQGVEMQNRRRRRNNKPELPMVDWEPWIEHDLHLLYETGVLQDWTVVNFDQYAGSAEEHAAWQRYVMHPEGCMMIVGKSLYVIQLEIYYTAMKAAGKPTSDLLVMSSKQLQDAATQQATYNRILHHLNLTTPLALSNEQTKFHKTQVKPKTPMPEPLRQKLQMILEPYNQRLYKLLGWNASIW